MESPLGKALVTFIIPAFNEEANLSLTLALIHEKIAGRWPYEIIVLDDGSTDRTAEIATRLGARLFTRRSSTIGENRNFGAGQATGDVLVFLDADVSLTHQWALRFPATLELLRSQPRLVTGSHASVRAEAGWLERFWFANLSPERETTSLGSGHLIIAARFFRQLGGFDERLETGEDFELCVRARTEGGEVVNDPELVVVHRGTPETLAQFIRREAWHGISDFSTPASIAKSLVAKLTLLFLAIHVAIVASSPILHSPAPSLMATASLLGLLATCSIYKYRRSGLRVVLINSYIFYFYFLGRSLALFRRLALGARRMRSPRGATGHIA